MRPWPTQACSSCYCLAVLPTSSAPDHARPPTNQRAPAEGATAVSPLVVRERLLLWTLAAINFTHIVDFMIMMPLGPELTRLFAISDTQFGLLVSSYSLAAGVSGLLVSMVIDRFERKRALLWLYAGFALATLACGLAPTFATLMPCPTSGAARPWVW
jgi:hypothetical protein